MLHSREVLTRAFGADRQCIPGHPPRNLGIWLVSSRPGDYFQFCVVKNYPFSVTIRHVCVHTYSGQEQHFTSPFPDGRTRHKAHWILKVCSLPSSQWLRWESFFCSMEQLSLTDKPQKSHNTTNLSVGTLERSAGDFLCATAEDTSGPRTAPAVPRGRPTV